MIPATAPVTENHNADNWAGYAAVNGNFTDASTGYVEPGIGTSCAGAAEVTWMGIGGDTLANPAANTLEQEGTGWGVPNLQQHQAWWEIFPAFNITPMTVIAHSGDVMYADTSFAGQIFGKGVFQFTVTDETTGITQTVETAAPNGYSLATAEAIYERPGIQNQLPPLANAGTVDFYPVTANHQGINNFNLDQITMYPQVGPLHVLAQPNALNGNDAYSVSYVACQ